jgi:transaldolase
MSLKSLIGTGTKVWLDSIDPDEVDKNLARGITGATSNPIIIGDIINTGAFDEKMAALMDQGHDDEELAWKLTDHLVKQAQEAFAPVWEKTAGNDGYVSFELDPLLEDAESPTPHETAAKRYVELAKQWSAGHRNRMIKIPATKAGIGCLEEVAAAGVTINVTLCFSERQYVAARDAIWRGAQRRKDGLSKFKSVYSIFISRVDVYTEKHIPQLSDDSQGMVGIVNAKQLWRMNQEYWRNKGLPLQQEIIFASTGKKLNWQSDDYYVAALAGSDIQTNPPATIDAVALMKKQYIRQVDELPPKEVLAEIERRVDQQAMEDKLMEEGTKKFADPQKALLKLIREKRQSLAQK